MKKKIAIAALTIMMSLGTLPVVAFAHCSHGGGGYYNYTSASQYGYCNYAGCRLGYNHTHNGVNYYGHTLDDGHHHAGLVYSGAMHR